MPLSMDYNCVANQVVKPALVFPESNHQEAYEENQFRKHLRQGAAELPAQPRPGAVRSQDAQAENAFTG